MNTIEFKQAAIAYKKAYRAAKKTEAALREAKDLLIDIEMPISVSKAPDPREMAAHVAHQASSAQYFSPGAGRSLPDTGAGCQRDHDQDGENTLPVLAIQFGGSWGRPRSVGP